VIGVLHYRIDDFVCAYMMVFGGVGEGFFRLEIREPPAPFDGPSRLLPF